MTQWTYPAPMGKDPAEEGRPGLGYPLGQYTAADTPPVTALKKGVRTLLPLITPAAGNARSFSDFMTSRVAADGTRIVPASTTERVLLRVSMKLAIDPTNNPLTNILDSTLRTLSDTGPFGYALNTPQALQTEIDVGPVGTPNVIFADSAVLQFLPQTVGIFTALFGGAPFLANGARIYVTSTTSGVVVTDVRTLLLQSRA